MPVLVVMCEARESRHGTRVVVLDPLDHLPHLLASLLLLEDPGLLVACDALPAETAATMYPQSQTATVTSETRTGGFGPGGSPEGVKVPSSVSQFVPQLGL